MGGRSVSLYICACGTPLPIKGIYLLKLFKGLALRQSLSCMKIRLHIIVSWLVAAERCSPALNAGDVERIQREFYVLTLSFLYAARQFKREFLRKRPHSLE